MKFEHYKSDAKERSLRRPKAGLLVYDSVLEMSLKCSKNFKKTSVARPEWAKRVIGYEVRERGSSLIPAELLGTADGLSRVLT